MDQNENSRFSLKIVIVLSLFLVSMDFLEIYLAFNRLNQDKIRYPPQIFETCIQYHIITQIVFTIFASLAGISAMLMGMGLLMDTTFFTEKLIRSYLYFNYNIFGPFLLSACVLGVANSSKVLFSCDKTMTRTSLNISNLMSLIVCFILSAVVTICYTFFSSFKIIFLSIRFKEGGFRPLGKLFWHYARANNDENEYLNQNNNMNIGMDQEPVNQLDYSMISLENNLSQIINGNHNNSSIQSVNRSRSDDNNPEEIEMCLKEIKEEEKKSDQLCEMLQKIIDNGNSSEEAKARALNALNSRKKVLGID